MMLDCSNVVHLPNIPPADDRNVAPRSRTTRHWLTTPDPIDGPPEQTVQMDGSAYPSLTELRTERLLLRRWRESAGDRDLMIAVCRTGDSDGSQRRHLQRQVLREFVGEN